MPNSAIAALGRGGESGAMLALIRQLSRARSQDEIMAIVSHAVRTLLQADGATFVLRDGDRCHYAEEDAISPLWKGRRFPIESCVSGWCMLNNRAAAIPDIYRDPRVPADAYRPTFVRSLIIAPVGRDEAVAALGAYWADLRQPRPEEVERLQVIADAAALAVANAQLRAALDSPRRLAAPGAIRKLRQRASFVGATLGGSLYRVGTEGLRRGSAESWIFVLACVAVATGLREAVQASGVRGLAVYSTYYPAVLLSVLLGGWRAGALAAALGGLAAYFLFMQPLYRLAPLTLADGYNLSLYAGSCALIILIVDWHQRAVRRLKHADARHLTLAREQRHRVKNALAVVEAVVHQSLRDAPETARIINQRIRLGLADVDIEDRQAAQPVSLRELLGQELRAYDLSRFKLEGEDERLVSPDTGRLLALAAHELATNALKHGALSTPQGRVAVAWRYESGGLTVDWRESGGPPVVALARRGYGSIMLRRLVEAAGGTLGLDFKPDGLQAHLTLSQEPPRRG